ncbi:alcohol dehydrogenase [Fonsecaea pedrosoi]|nr:alcohol dehydrogenase [Fonsecaea pedrosoi]
MAISADLPQSMKAVVFQQANGRLAVTEKPLPELAPGDLLVKVVAASLCASDIVPWQGFLGDPKGIVPGHEGVGIVVKGADYIFEEPVRGFKVGDRVGFVNAIRTCGSCAACLAGHGQCCENGKKNQGFHLDGFFAQYTVVDWQFTVKIPDSLPLEKLSPLFCAGITAYGAVKKVDAPGRGYLGVFGLGGVGTLVVRFAVALGYTVIGFDVSPTARSSASNYGATEVVDPSDLQSTKQAVEKITNGKGLDGAVVAVGSQAAYEGALETIGFGK